jgi:CheY-like chemotaxis protein
MKAAMPQPEIVWRGTIEIDEAPAPEATAPVVLVVTADVGLREASTRVLAREGYRVITAPHAGHAVLASIRAGRVDLLATELSMEDVSGPALAEQLRRRYPELAAVYFASPGSHECDGVLVRPFTRDDLLEALMMAALPASCSVTSAS